MTIVLKRYYGLPACNVHTKRLVLGRRAIRRGIAMQLAEFRRQAHVYLGGAPIILGETGVPFDLGDRRVYHTGDYRAQIAVVDRTMTGIESTLLSSCWWNLFRTTTIPMAINGMARTFPFSAETNSRIHPTPAPEGAHWKPWCAHTGGLSQVSRV